MDSNNPYAPPSTYQVDNSLMRPANLPPLSMQTIGSDRSSGFRNGGPPPYGGAGPDRNAPRRGGFRGGAPRGRPPPGRGGRDFPDRGGNDFQGNHNGWNNNAPSGGYDRNGYQVNGYQGDYGHAPAPEFGQGGYAGNQGNSYGRDSGFAPSRNEFDGGFDRGNPPRMHDRGPAPFQSEKGRYLDERVHQERPCRILFVRNVNYTADSGRIRADFEKFGEIKTFFDIIATRGMAFITYYDLRAAERAREEMHNSLVNSRPIDVHFSLPKAEEGSLEVALRNGRPLSVDEARRTLASFGEIKEVRPGPSPDKKVVEFYDARRAIDAHDALNGRPHQDTEMLVRFIWDHPDIARSSVPAGAGRGRGQRGGRGRGGDRGDERERSPDHTYSRSAPYSSDRSRRRSSEAGTIASTVGNKDPSARLDEAKKIQDLLASLSQGGLAKPAAPQPTQTSYAQSANYKPNAPPTMSAQGNRPSGYTNQAQPQSQQSQQYPYPSAYAMPSSNAYAPPSHSTVTAQKPAITPVYVPPSAPNMASPALGVPPYVPASVPGVSQAPTGTAASAGQARPEPAHSGYGRTPMPQTSGLPATYPSSGASGPPSSMQGPGSNGPSYPYVPSAGLPNGSSGLPVSTYAARSNTPSLAYVPPAAAPAPSAPQVAPGMSDLLALLAAQQRK